MEELPTSLNKITKSWDVKWYCTVSRGTEKPKGQIPQQ